MPTACSLKTRPGYSEGYPLRRGLTAFRSGWFCAVVLLVFIGRSSAQPTTPPDRDDLLKGLGMGLATIADLNNYPAPQRVIELKAQLGLTRDQQKKTEALEKGDTSAAIAKGEEIVQAEQDLDTLFASGTISEKVLRSRLEGIGKLRADLRFIHLQAHLRMKQILTPDQLKLYAEIKGHEAKLEN
jgi:hypothetical protein